MKLILISGPSGSGKTTLSKKLREKIQHSIVISTDNYYKTGLVSMMLSKFIDGYFDRKISLNYNLLKKDIRFIIKNGYLNSLRSYNFNSKKITKFTIKTQNIKYLIVEGIFARDILSIMDKKDYFFFELKKNKNYCMNKVIERDFIERGKAKKLAKKDFLKSWDIYYSRSKNISSKKDSDEFTLIKNSDLEKILDRIFNYES